MEAVVAGFDDQQGFFLEGAGACSRIGEIVGWLMNHGIKSGAEVFYDDV